MKGRFMDARLAFKACIALFEKLIYVWHGS